MVLGEQLALHLENALRVAHMRHELARNLRHRVVLAGEDLLPRLEHRVLIVPRVQVHRTVVRVDRGLDRIADVVRLLVAKLLHRIRAQRRRILRGGGEVGHLRVRVLVGRRVAVDDPLHTAVHNSRVDAAIEGEVRRHLGHAFARGTVVEDLRLWGHAVGEQDLV